MYSMRHADRSGAGENPFCQSLLEEVLSRCYWNKDTLRYFLDRIKALKYVRGGSEISQTSRYSSYMEGELE